MKNGESVKHYYNFVVKWPLVILDQVDESWIQHVQTLTNKTKQQQPVFKMLIWAFYFSRTK